MRQFLFGLLFAGILWWGYSAWSGRGASAAGSLPNEPEPGALQPAGHDADAPVTPPVQTPAPAPDATPAGAMRSLDAATSPEERSAAESLATRLASGETAAFAETFAQLAADRFSPSLRSQLARKLIETPADDAAAAVQRLGDNNAFLHSPEGRTAALAAADMVGKLTDEKAVPLYTGLLERCMRGSIEKAQTDVHQTVDTIWKAARVRADHWLCDPTNVAGARSYVVGRGDALDSIAAKFRKQGLHVESGTLAVLNRLNNPNHLSAGQKLKIPVEPIHCVVEKRSFLLAVYLGDSMLRLYWVGHGADGHTPVAEFTVQEKIEHPDWDSPNGRIPYGKPENILGDYFIKFAHESHQGFGAHGTPMPETIGTMSSMGCIRMYAADIQELFKLLPRGSKFAVRDDN
jgi:nucleoid-associated protein YgaU